MKYLFSLSLILSSGVAVSGCQKNSPAPSAPIVAVTPSSPAVTAPAASNLPPVNFRDETANLRGQIATGEVLVYFEKNDCLACARMLPMVTQLAAEKNVRLLRIMPTREEVIGFGVGHYPTTVLYRDGRELNRWLGEISKNKFFNEFERATREGK